MHDQHEQKKCLIVFKKGILYKALNLLEVNIKQILNSLTFVMLNFVSA